MSVGDPYCKYYPVKHFCEECGWWGAEFTDTVCRSHKSRLNSPLYGPHCEKQYSEGKCGVCGKEGRVGTPWAFGTPRMTNYLWGPDFTRGNE